MAVHSDDGLVVVGGGPAALEAARAYRDAGGSGPLTMLSADQHAPYNRPPLSKDHLRGEIEPAELALEDEQFYARHEVDLRLGTRVVELLPGEHRLRCQDGEVLAYGTCVLATGSSPTPLPVPGAEHEDVLYLRSRTHGEALRDRAGRAGSAVVVGSGFIGCEAAASLAMAGLEVTLVTQEPRPQQDRLGEAAARRIAGWLEAAGVRLVGGVEVEAVHEGHRVELAGGASHTGDLVLLATGVSPHVELAERAGVGCDAGRVRTDSSMRTDTPGVLAAGDVALAHNDAARRPLAVEHWGEALRMGEIAGKVAAGGSDTWSQVPGFWSEIGQHTLKYAAWGDGFDDARLVDHGHDAFTVWFSRSDAVVGVLTHGADDDYERGAELVASAAAPPQDAR